MKIIIRNENGIEEVLYEPNPIQEKPLNQSMIKRIISYILIIFFILVGIFIVGNFIFAFFKFILNDTTMAIIAILIIISFCFLYLFNYSYSVTFMFIDKKTKSITIDYNFEYKKKRKKEILKFSDIKEIKLQEFYADEYGTSITEHLYLVKKEENWLGYNKKTQLNVPFEKGVEIAKAIGVDCRHVDKDKKSTTLYVGSVGSS
jgi:hypothetical protein